MTPIKVGDYVFCLGEGMAIFRVEHVDKRGAFLGPCVNPGEIGIGGNESLHKLERVCDSEWASQFPEFCNNETDPHENQKRECLTCGKVFMPTDKIQVFCGSDDCLEEFINQI